VWTVYFLTWYSQGNYKNYNNNYTMTRKESSEDLQAGEGIIVYYFLHRDDVNKFKCKK